MLKNKKEISKKLIVASAMTSVLALGLNIYGEPANAARTEMEKCAGIVKAGMNDCGANGHACGGLSTKDGDANEWIALPKGTCNKIVGAKVIGTEKSKKITQKEKCANIAKD